MIRDLAYSLVRRTASSAPLYGLLGYAFLGLALGRLLQSGLDSVFIGALVTGGMILRGNCWKYRYEKLGRALLHGRTVPRQRPMSGSEEEEAMAEYLDGDVTASIEAVIGGRLRELPEAPEKYGRLDIDLRAHFETHPCVACAQSACVHLILTEENHPNRWLDLCHRHMDELHRALPRNYWEPK